MDCSPRVPFVHGISQARILESVAISFSRLFTRPRDWTHVSCNDKNFLYHWATREAWFRNICLHLKHQLPRWLPNITGDFFKVFISLSFAFQLFFWMNFRSSQPWDNMILKISNNKHIFVRNSNGIRKYLMTLFAFKSSRSPQVY